MGKIYVELSMGSVVTKIVEDVSNSVVEEPNKEGHDETIGVDKSFDEAVEVMALRKDKNRSGLGRVTSSGDVVRTGPEEEWFAIQEGFPTTWRVSRRHWDTLFPIGKEQIDWMHRVGIQIGVQTEEEKEQAVRLLWIWRDIFVEQLCDLPMTDLVTHAGPVSLPPRGGPWELLAGVSDANRDRGRGGGFRYVCSSFSGGFGM